MRPRPPQYASMEQQLLHLFVDERNKNRSWLEKEIKEIQGLLEMLINKSEVK